MYMDLLTTVIVYHGIATVHDGITLWWYRFLLQYPTFAASPHAHWWRPENHQTRNARCFED